MIISFADTSDLLSWNLDVTLNHLITTPDYNNIELQSKNLLWD